MVTRIVKLTFEESRVSDFLAFFDSIKELVNNFPGCTGIQLIQDVDNPNIFFTYSHWKTEIDLATYRDSETFGGVWPIIKPWFSARPEAWTTRIVFNGFDK